MALTRAPCNHQKLPGALPIHIAAHRGSLGNSPLAPWVLSAVISASRLDINALNGAGKTPLHIACGTGDEKMVKDILDAGMDPATVVWDKKKRQDLMCKDLVWNSGRWFHPDIWYRL